jgi:Clp amino terminal domain, pathogenicity island component
MFDSFSLRARQILFLARVKAGERGANRIDVDDFLVGLILEDQGMLEKSVVGQVHEGTVHFVNQAPLHIPFFSPEIANDLLAKIEGILPRSQSVASSTDIPLSSAVAQAFNSAEEIQTRFRHSQLEPLHLLAGLLKEESSPGVKLLQDSGVTREKVLLKLGNATES